MVFMQPSPNLANLSQMPAISAIRLASENGPGNPGPLV